MKISPQLTLRHTIESLGFGPVEAQYVSPIKLHQFIQRVVVLRHRTPQLSRRELIDKALGMLP